MNISKNKTELKYDEKYERFLELNSTKRLADRYSSVGTETG
jgi:hypothetical protein